MPAENRIALLDNEVAKAVRSGWQVQSRTDFQAILTKPHKIGLWLNLALSLINRKHDTRTITVDVAGKVRG